MGGNGSFSKGAANTEEGREFKCVAVLSGNVKVLVPKDRKKGVKLPEESHTPGRIYVSLHAKGALIGQLKAIGVYDANGLKEYEIHTTDHHSLALHCHLWHDGRPEDKRSKTYARPLTTEMLKLYNDIQKRL